jgi:hypothetical protein
VKKFHTSKKNRGKFTRSEKFFVFFFYFSAGDASQRKMEILNCLGLQWEKSLNVKEKIEAFVKLKNNEKLESFEKA